MTGRLILILASLFFAIDSIAQNNSAISDSLIRQIKKTKEKDKPSLFIAIAEDYLIRSGDSTLLYATKAKDYAIRYNDKNTEAKAYILIGKTERNQGLYEQALSNTLKGLKIAEQHGDEQELSTIYNSIGILYKRIRRFNDALVYYKTANQLAQKHNQHRATSLTYNNIGTIYLEWEEWDKVVEYYDSAMVFAKLANDTRAMATVLTNYGDTYLTHKKYDSALVKFKLALQYDKANDDKYGMFMCYFQIARVYADLKQYNYSEDYVDSARAIATAERMQRNLIDLYGWGANIAKKRGDFKKAFDYFKTSKLINDTLFNEISARQVSELQTKYETAKKEQRIAVQASELSKKNYIILSIIGLLALIILLGYSYYNRYKLKQQDRLQKAIINQQELATQAVIEAEEKERKRIAGDLHDGVGQVMSAARMNLNAIKNELQFENQEQELAFEKALSLVDEGCNEVRAVSHNIMPNALLKAGLISAIRELTEKIDHRVLEVNLYSDGLDERLASNVETVLYRVIQECVNNVIKHANATTLDITLIHDEDGISVTIEDNGKGFDTHSIKHQEGIGLKNIQSRINYLKGTIEWDATEDRGTIVMIHLPSSKIV